MYGFVIEPGEKKAAPDDKQITKAVTNCGSSVAGQIIADGQKRTVYYTGNVISTTTFRNALIAVVGGNAGQNSWVISPVESSIPAASTGVDAGAGGSAYSVRITMPQATVEAYQARGFKLYGFKSVQGPTGGSPLVWFVTEKYSTATTIKWTEEYQAYTSISQIVPNGRVEAVYSAGIDLGQTLVVNSQAGTGTVTTGDTPRAIRIENQTSTEFACGISQVVDGVAQPICAFPLFEHMAEVIAPIERVLLMFASETVDTGTVLERAVGQSVLIDLTSANQRTIAYDKKDGWQSDLTWAKVNPPNSALAPLLIDTPQAVSGTQDTLRCLTGAGARALL